MITFVDEENQKKPKKTKVLVEKYRPNTLKGVILPNKYKKYFKDIVASGEIPNMLLYSTGPGVGKTTIAKALANDCNYQHMFINISLRGGIDTLRDKIEKFASAKSFDGRKKVVILDEFDGSTPNLQAALRGAVEEFYDRCTFILTANYMNKIIDPLKSRFECIDFNMLETKSKQELLPQIQKRLKTIIRLEEIESEDGVIDKIAETFYPDIRTMINLIASYSKQYDVLTNGIFTHQDIDDSLSDMIIDRKLTKARQFIIDNNYKYEELYTYLFDVLVPKLDNTVQGAVIVSIEHYMNNSMNSMNPEITFTACLISIIEDVYGG